jgi:hypothetical protein
MKNAIQRRLLLPVLVLVIPMFGCGAPIVPVAIWLGKVILYTAAVKATVQLVDQVLGQNSQRVSNDVVPNRGDPNRGILPLLTIGKKKSDGTPSNEAITFTNVPVVRSADGKWIVEQYYTDTVIDPKLRSAN